VTEAETESINNPPLITGGREMGVHCGRHTNDGVSLTSVFSRSPTREHGNTFVSDLAKTIFSGRTGLCG